MPRRIEYSARLTENAERTYGALADRAYWDALMERLREFTPVSVVESFDAGNDGIRVEMTQVISREMMPAVAQTVLQSDLVITRLAMIGPFAAGTVTEGSFSATIPAAPGSLEGRITLRDADSGSELRYAPEAKVNIPFVGGKLEDLILENLVNLFTLEEEFTNHWLRTHP